MADLNELGYFKLTGAARIVAADSTDPGVFPDAWAVNCDVTIQPRLVGPNTGGQALTITATNPDLLVLLAPIAARMEGGTLRLRRTEGDDSEASDPTGEPGGVWLLAQTAALNLPEGASLVYDVIFGRILLGANRFALDTITFAAATEPGSVLSISTVDRLNLPSSRGGLELRMIPDGWDMSDEGVLRFFAAGVELPAANSNNVVNIDAIVGDRLDTAVGGLHDSRDAAIVDVGTARDAAVTTVVAAVTDAAPLAVSSELATRELTAEYTGGGMVQFFLGGVPMGDPVALPAAGWDSLLGIPNFIAAGGSAEDARHEIRAVGQGDLVVNVADFGINVGTGGDDTAAINDALLELHARATSTGAAGILYFPPGDYGDTAARVIPSNRRIHVEGAGIDTSTITRLSGSSGDWWTFKARHSGISRLTLSGGRYQGVTGDNIVLDASYTYVREVWTQKAGGTGLTIGKDSAAIVHRLTDVYVRENAGRGIDVVSASGSTDGMWSNIEVGNNGRYGTYIGTGSQNISNLHVWGSGLESDTEFDGVFIASGNNELVNAQSEKNLGRGYRIESNGNTVRGRAWGNKFGALYVNSGSYNDIDLVSYRNSVGNPSATLSDSYAQCIMAGTSVRNRIRMKVWDDTVDMAAGTYVSAPTYAYPGRSAIRTHTRALVELSANCDFNVYDFDAPREVTRLSGTNMPYLVQGVNNVFTPSCNWGTGALLPSQSVVTGQVRVPTYSDTIIVAVGQEITQVLGHRAGRVVRIIWTAASPQPIRQSSELRIRGDFSPTTGATMALVSDGTTWYELSRSS